MKRAYRQTRFGRHALPKVLQIVCGTCIVVRKQYYLLHFVASDGGKSHPSIGLFYKIEKKQKPQDSGVNLARKATVLEAAACQITIRFLKKHAFNIFFQKNVNFKFHKTAELLGPILGPPRREQKTSYPC